MNRPGDIVAQRYRLEEAVDEGGMATVWRATHVDLGHPVAVKFNTVRGPGADAAAERFLREARVAASVRHRHIVDVIDFGLTDDRVPFIVMEFLEGVNLGDRMGMEPPLPVHAFGEILIATLRGLAAVHDAGIVHRDIKPENIYLVEDGDETVPKLLDFGISRATAAAPGLKSSVPTVEGVLVGTPEYMSPEQARGLKDVDWRTDLYSLGVVAYEALTGRLPYDTENIGDLLIQITTGVATPVSRLRPDLGQPLSDWVERAMARQREARFSDARAMREALVEALETTARVATGWSAATLARVGGGDVVGLPSGAPTLAPDDLRRESATLAGDDRRDAETLDPEADVVALRQARTTGPDTLARALKRPRRGIWIVGASAALAAAIGVGLAARPSGAETRRPRGVVASGPAAEPARSTPSPAPSAPTAAPSAGATATSAEPTPMATADAGIALDASQASGAIDRAATAAATRHGPRRPRLRRRRRPAGGATALRPVGTGMRPRVRPRERVTPFSDPGF